MVFDQIIIQVQLILDKVLGRRGEAGGNGGEIEGEVERGFGLGPVELGVLFFKPGKITFQEFIKIRRLDLPLADLRGFDLAGSQVAENGFFADAKILGQVFGFEVVCHKKERLEIERLDIKS